MKNRVIVIFFLIMLCKCSIEPDGNKINSVECFPEAADKFLYPIVSVLDLESPEEYINVFQLPDEVLKNISTFGLICSFLDIPMISSSYYASSASSSVIRCNRVYPTYNSIIEFLERKDAAKSLILFFDAICFDCLEKQKKINKMVLEDQIYEAGKRLTLIAQLAFVEVLFTQQKVLVQLSYEEKQLVVRMLLLNIEKIQELKIDGFIDPAAIEVMAHIMYNSNYNPVVEYFSDNTHLDINANHSKKIITFAKQFIH